MYTPVFFVCFFGFFFFFCFFVVVVFSWGIESLFSISIVFCYSVNFVGNVAVEFQLLIINTMYDAVSFRTLTALF